MATLDKFSDQNLSAKQTSYREGSMTMWGISVLDRGFIECRDRYGNAIHVSSSSDIYRRLLLERYRFQPGPGPFVSAHVRHDVMNEDGIEIAVGTRAVSVPS